MDVGLDDGASRISLSSWRKKTNGKIRQVHVIDQGSHRNNNAEEVIIVGTSVTDKHLEPDGFKMAATAD